MIRHYYDSAYRHTHHSQHSPQFTMGFLSFPIPFLGGLKTAIDAKNRIEATVRDIVPRARAYVQTGKPPRCLMERWSLAILEAAREQGLDDPQQVDCCTDDDLARTVLDFLFAAQDATNSGLVYTLDVLDEHRDVLQKMRDEVDAKVGEKKEVYQATRESDGLQYIAKVANELLHHKPPVPMIPHISKKATTLGGHNIGKGTVCIPNITYCARVTGTSTEFNPDREDKDTQFVKGITFGGGQHKCPGRRYAECLLNVFCAVVAQEYDFCRTGPRPGPNDFIYYPTVFPEDSKFLIKWREAQ